MSMRIQLTDDRRDQMIRSIQQFASDHLDWELSDYQSQELLEFLVKELGAPVYNQAIRDAHSFLLEKLTDLEGDFYEPEEPYSR